MPSLSLEALEIPFKTAFKHASAERSKTQSILVKACSDGGIAGWGEGCPREYVTGEGIASCRDFFARHHKTWSRFSGPDEVARWAQEHEDQVDGNPAAWCGVELALLDLFAKERSRSVESVLGVPELSGGFAYSAVLGDSSLPVYQSQVRRYAALGFSDFKVKISGDLPADNVKLEFLRAEAMPGFRLRLDANNLWRGPKEALAYLRGLTFLPFAVEEPLAAFDYTGCGEIADGAGVRIILDESFLRRGHFDSIKGRETSFAINVRVSKMGGLTRSLEIAAEAGRRGVPMILGAQVGETSILTRAALTVANAHRENLLAQEGAFGTFLLESDLVRNPLMFGKAGRLDPADFLEAEGSGWRLAMDPTRER